MLHELRRSLPGASETRRHDLALNENCAHLNFKYNAIQRLIAQALKFEVFSGT